MLQGKKCIIIQLCDIEMNLWYYVLFHELIKFFTSVLDRTKPGTINPNPSNCMCLCVCVHRHLDLTWDRSTWRVELESWDLTPLILEGLWNMASELYPDVADRACWINHTYSTSIGTAPECRSPGADFKSRAAVCKFYYFWFSKCNSLYLLNSILHH